MASSPQSLPIRYQHTAGNLTKLLSAFWQSLGRVALLSHLSPPRVCPDSGWVCHQLLDNNPSFISFSRSLRVSRRPSYLPLPVCLFSAAAAAKHERRRPSRRRANSKPGRCLATRRRTTPSCRSLRERSVFFGGGVACMRHWHA